MRQHRVISLFVVKSNACSRVDPSWPFNELDFGCGWAEGGLEVVHVLFHKVHGVGFEKEFPHAQDQTDHFHRRVVQLVEKDKVNEF